MAKLELAGNEWKIFMETFPCNDFLTDYFDLSDEEEKKMMEEEYTTRIKSMKGTSLPEISGLKRKKGETKKTQKKGISLTNDDDYTEPSNSAEIASAEKKILSLGHAKYSDRLFQLTDVDNMGFRLNNRRTEKIDEETNRELNRTRDVLNDPNVKVEGTSIIISIPSYAHKKKIKIAKFKRPMDHDELKQISGRMPVLKSPFIDKVMQDMEKDTGLEIL